MISMNIMWKLLFKKRKRVMWLEVPINCISRGEKDNVILGIINHLEQTIKIN